VYAPPSQVVNDPRETSVDGEFLTSDDANQHLTGSVPVRKVQPMAVRPVVIWPDPRLREPTRKVEAVDNAVRALFRDLTDTMYAENGLGIAAIQIGDPTAMFLVEPKLAGRAESDPPLACINPEVLWVSEETEETEEGCLSFPEIYIKVDRPLRAKLRAMDIDGNTFEIEGEGLLARCLLHEFDHLGGKLLVDFAGPLKRQMIKKKLQRRLRDDSTEDAV
jgi:peptide deformylase